MLEPMMKILMAMIVGLLLAACAGPRYYPAQSSGEGSYYIARSTGATTIYALDGRYGYSLFPAYGIYPWWTYSYYSPYFYPHHFAVWQPGWPYYTDGYWGWYGGYVEGYPIWSHHPHWPPQPSPVMPEAPTIGLPLRPAPPRQAAERMAGQPALYRQAARQGGPRWQAGFASAEPQPQGIVRPSANSRAARSFESPGAATPDRGFRSAPAMTFPTPAERAGHSRGPLARVPSQRDP